MMEEEVLYIDQELLLEIKNLIDDINDSNLHHLRECASLIHDINKGYMLTITKEYINGNII
jgi:hypothetical protein